MYPTNPWISFYPYRNMAFPHNLCTCPYHTPQYLSNIGNGNDFREGDTAFINVAVATLWSSPDKPRPGIDDPAISNPVDMWKWTRSLSIEQRKDLIGRTETQGLLGNKVTITQRQGDWAKILLHGQPTPNNPTGYPGWVPAIQLTYNANFDQLTNAPFILVTQNTATLFKTSYLSDALMEISYNTRLPIVGKSGNLSFRVLLPNGDAAWIKQKDVQKYNRPTDIPRPTGESIVRSAEKFLGLPYLWGGTSGFGYDCSGLTFSMYNAHGITIPRDSGPQSKAGVAVELDQLRPGDLIFFAKDRGTGAVYHVGIYKGNGLMVHAPNSEATVEIVELRTNSRFENYAGARRYIV